MSNGKKVFVILLFLILVYTRVFLIINHEIKINTFYIKKSVCAYAPSKTAVLFIDQRAFRNFKYLGISTEEILNSVNNQFKAQNLPIRYEVKTRKIFYWPIEKGFNVHLSSDPRDKKGYVLDELESKIKLIRKNFDPDVIIFITGSLSEIYAKSFWLEKNPDGNGIVLINFGFNPLLKKRSLGVKKFFLRGYGQILTHEEGHLYGLRHTTDFNSIMKEVIQFGDPKLKFDKESLNQLEKTLKGLKFSQEKCAAR